MIERLLTSSGKTVLLYEGRRVCSLEPEREATSWVQRNSLRLRGVQNVIVLGVGCGYHLVALRKYLPEATILAIETKSDFLEFTRGESSLDLSDVMFLHARGATDLRKNCVLRDLLKDNYTVLKFVPAQIGDEVLYREMEDLLLARNIEGLRYVLSLRSDLCRSLEVDSEKNWIDPLGELFSIKTLEKMLSQQADGEVRLILKSLREMVR